MIVPTRRGLLLGFASLLAAPAIVRASSLMPVKQLLGELELWDGPADTFSEMVTATLRKRGPRLYDSVTQHNAFYEALRGS